MKSLVKPQYFEDKTSSIQAKQVKHKTVLENIWSKTILLHLKHEGYVPDKYQYSEAIDH